MNTLTLIIAVISSLIGGGVLGFYFVYRWNRISFIYYRDLSNVQEDHIAGLNKSLDSYQKLVDDLIKQLYGNTEFYNERIRSLITPVSPAADSTKASGTN